MKSLFTVALISPQIPPNTGNIARLCAATQMKLDLVGELGFQIDDAHLKRAGLDYWDEVDLARHEDEVAYFNSKKRSTIHILSKKVERPYFECEFKPGDTLVFGSETTGVDESYLEKYSDRCALIPMRSDSVRCLNLSTSVGIVLYEAIRQNLDVYK